MLCHITWLCIYYGFEDEGLVADPDAEVTDVLSEDGDDKVDEEIEAMSEGRLEAIQVYDDSIVCKFDYLAQS